MTKILIDTKKLGRKEPTELKSNVSNIKKSLQFRGQMFDLDNLTKEFEGSDDTYGYLSADNKRMSQQFFFTIDFLTDILDLSEKEVKKLDDLSWDELSAISGEVNFKIMNPEEEEGTEKGTPSKSK